MQKQFWAVGGPLGVVVIGLSIAGYTSHTVGLIIAGVGALWLVADFFWLRRRRKDHGMTDDKSKMNEIDGATINAEGEDADEVVGLDIDTPTRVRNTRVTASGKAKRIIGVRATAISTGPPKNPPPPPEPSPAGTVHMAVVCEGCGAAFGVTNAQSCARCGRPFG